MTPPTNERGKEHPYCFAPGCPRRPIWRDWCGWGWCFVRFLDAADAIDEENGCASPRLRAPTLGAGMVKPEVPTKESGELIPADEMERIRNYLAQWSYTVGTETPEGVPLAKQLLRHIDALEAERPE